MLTATKSDNKTTNNSVAANLVKPKEHDKNGIDDIASFEAVGIQMKLIIGDPGDKYEQEADRVADKVVSMPAPKPVQGKCADCEVPNESEGTIQKEPLARDITPWVQKQVERSEIPIAQRIGEEEKEEPIQTKRFSPENDTPGASIESSLSSSKMTQQTTLTNSTTHDLPFFGQSREARSIKTNAHENGPLTNASPRFAPLSSRTPSQARTQAKIQPKVMVSTSEDLDEKEADRVADQVMSMPGSKLQRQVVQRQETGGNEAEEQNDTNEANLEGPFDCAPVVEDPGQTRAEGEAPAPSEGRRNPGGEDFDPNSIPAQRARLLLERGEFRMRRGRQFYIYVELGDLYNNFVRNVVEAPQIASQFDTGRHRHPGQSSEEQRRASRLPEDYVVREQFVRQARPHVGADPYLLTIYRSRVNTPCEWDPSAHVLLTVVIYRRVDAENPRGRVIIGLQFNLSGLQPCATPPVTLHFDRNAAVAQARSHIVMAMPRQRRVTTQGEGRIQDPALGIANGYLQAWRNYQRTASMPGRYRTPDNEDGRQRAVQEFRNLRRQPDHVWRAILCNPVNLSSMINRIDQNYQQLVREVMQPPGH